MAQVYDQFTDDRHEILVQIARDNKDVIDHVKTAGVSPSDELPTTAYAWPDRRLFPIHSPEQALLSKAYSVKQASVPTDVVNRIDQALDLYGVNIPESLKVVKEASAPSDSDYLLPQHRRLLFQAPEHAAPVADAIVSQAYQLKTASLATAATGFIKRAAVMGLTEKDVPAPMWKYAGMTTCDAGVLLDWVEARAMACPDLDTRGTFDKIAQVITENFPPTGIISNREDLTKIAQSIEDADDAAGLAYLYGNRLPNPLETVFNMDKVAEAMVDLGGSSFPVSKLMAIPPETLEEVLGEGALDSVTMDGQIDPEQFAAMLSTLPADLIALLKTYIGPML